MAKRFTDTSKWRRPWFRQLSKEAKLVWGYLCDECDHAGIWIADFDLISFQLDFRVTEVQLKTWLGDKLVRVDHDKYFIPSFFEYQYGDAKDGFKAKQSAIKILKSFGVIEESTDSLIDLSNSYLSVTKQSPDCLSIGKSKIKSKSNTGSAEGAAAGEPLATDADREAVYEKYGKKVGKSEGLAKLKKLCPTKRELAEFERAMLAYVADCKRCDRFLKQFDTFVNSKWRDWLDPSTSGAEPASPGSMTDAEYAAREAAIFGEGA